jgi:glycosyltransferase involved in cell wall biosynthesis
MIPVYNAGNFIEETLRSVLAATAVLESVQIEVVDDASTDINVQEVVERVGQGKITYFCQSSNVGSLRNFETCINRSRGQLVHLLHADDLVSPGYYAEVQALFEEYPEAGAAFTRYEYINEKGEVTNTKPKVFPQAGVYPDYLEILAYQQKQQYCVTTVKRSVYEALGSFYGVTYGEDWEMWLRIAANYPVAYSPKILGSYRLHSQSVSGGAFVSGQNLKDLAWVFSKTLEYLPDSRGTRAVAYARKIYAYHAINIANQLWHTSQNITGVRNQVKGALKMHQDLRIYWKILKLYAKIGLRYS